MGIRENPILEYGGSERQRPKGTSGKSAGSAHMVPLPIRIYVARVEGGGEEREMSGREERARERRKRREERSG